MRANVGKYPDFASQLSSSSHPKTVTNTLRDPKFAQLTQ